MKHILLPLVLAGTTLTAAAQPYAKNISPISAQSVAFTDASHGFIVGDRAKILSTSDGGHRWDHFYTGVEKFYNKVKFFDQNLGVVIGENKTMLVTHNGGGSWQQITGDFGMGSDNGNFTDITFIDANTWLVGTFNAVLKTTDGGGNWTMITTNTNNQVNRMEFVDSQNGFFTANAGYGFNKSTDGGNTWSFSVVISISAKPNAMKFFNTMEGVLALDDGKIVRTTDGGGSFTAVYTGTMSLYGLSFSDNQNGFCVGEDGTVLKTNDAGQTWTDISAVGVPHDLYGVYADGGNAVAMGEYGVRVRSNGSTSTLESDWYIENHSIYAVEFLNEDIGLVAGYGQDQNSECLLRTTDGGGTWTKVASAGNGQFRSITFINSDTVYALGYTPISTVAAYVSMDGGASFTEVSIPYNNNNGGMATFNDLEHFGSDSIYILGNGLTYTVDGGANWTAVTEPSAYGYDLAMSNSQNMFVSSGSDGGIAQSTNGGTSFALSVINTPQGIESVDYADANTAFAAGDWGNIFKTTINGSSWTSVNAETFASNFRKIEFINSNTGLAIGGKMDALGTFTDPYILYTSDAGLNFQQIVAPHNFNFTYNALWDISVLEADLAFAAGESSNLYKICNTCNTVDVGTSISQSLSDNTLSMFPNPIKAGGMVKISNEQFSDGSFVIQTCEGKIAGTGMVMKQEIRIGNGFQPGIHFVNINSDGKMFNGKLVITE